MSKTEFKEMPVEYISNFEKDYERLKGFIYRHNVRVPVR